MRPTLIELDPLALSAIEREARRSADGSETGGILLGHEAVGNRPFRVTVAGDPGPQAQRSPNGFLRDLHHAESLASAAYDADGSIWVGEWHTHPGGPSSPSRRDLSTYGMLLNDAELEFSELVSLIVTPKARDWATVKIKGWLVRLAQASLSRPMVVGVAEIRSVALGRTSDDR